MWFPLSRFPIKNKYTVNSELPLLLLQQNCHPGLGWAEIWAEPLIYFAQFLFFIEYEVGKTHRNCELIEFKEECLKRPCPVWGRAFGPTASDGAGDASWLGSRIPHFSQLQRDPSVPNGEMEMPA